MKRIMTGATLFLMALATCHAMLYVPADEWMMDGPGGKYGVYSFHTQYSFVALGPFDIEIPLGFKATRTLFVGSTVAVGLSVLAAMVLTIKKIRQVER